MSEAAQEGGARPLLAHANLPVIERYGGRRGRQALVLLAAVQMLAPAARWLFRKAREGDDFSITVAGTDDIYPDLHEWVLERMPINDRKALIANTEAVDEFEQPGDSTEADLPKVKLRYDGSRSQTVKIGEHKVVVRVEREEIPGRINLPENWRQIMERITFLARSADGRDAVVAMMNDLLAAKYEGDRPPPLHMPSRWGSGWTRRGDLPPRTLDSVVLKRGQLERLVNDLATFLADEDEYVRMSQPWHRGYLFHGPPGTGKTSIARALANHFGLPTYYLPLGDIEKDTDLMSMVGAIEPRSVLLLEDADVFHSTTDRNEEQRTTSVAAMLNALDGVWTPHGLITILTTNDPERLDDALVREGRIDLDEEFSELDADQARRLTEQFEEPELAIEGFVGKSPAALIEALRRQKQARAPVEVAI